MLRLLIKQFLLMNIIKNKFLIVKKLLQFLDDHLEKNFHSGFIQPEFLKRTMYLMVLKNLTKDDEFSVESSLMSCFNEGFSELIKIVTMVRQLSFSKKLMIQMMLDRPDLMESNQNFRSIVNLAMTQSPDEMLTELDIQKENNQKRMPLDFEFDFGQRSYDVFIDNHAKHKIFCESVEQMIQREALSEMKALLLPFISDLEKLSTNPS